MDTFKYLAVTLLLGWALSTSSFGGQVVGLLTFTENSSTSLTATFVDSRGASVTDNLTSATGDSWLDDNFDIGNGSGDGFFWQEPESASTSNVVEVDGSEILIGSDFLTPPNIFPLADGTNTNTLGSMGVVATDTYGVAVYAVFNDNAEGSEGASVPDMGPTVMLLGIALVVLAWFQKLRQQRAA